MCECVYVYVYVCVCVVRVWVRARSEDWWEVREWGVHLKAWPVQASAAVHTSVFCVYVCDCATYVSLGPGLCKLLLLCVQVYFVCMYVIVQFLQQNTTACRHNTERPRFTCTL